MAIAYDGTFFGGMAQQPKLRTVVNELKKAMLSVGIKKPRIWFMSRTDRGVHSIYQIVAVKDRENLSIDALNFNLPRDIVIHRYTRINSNNPRRFISEKEYLYIAPNFGEDETILEETCNILSRQKWDYRGLIKRSRLYGNKTMMKINVRCNLNNDFQFFYFSGKTFFWEQVRRTVTLLKMVGLEKITFRELMDVLKGRYLKRGIPPAPAEGLILWGVKEKFDWRVIIDLNLLRRIFVDKMKRLAVLYSDKWIL